MPITSSAKKALRASKKKKSFNDKRRRDLREVLGSIIGKIDLKSMKVKSTKKISDSAKLEGLTVYNQSDKEITFLICEDNDTDEQESNIYKFSLKK